MFRPGLGQESPQGTPRPPYPGPPRSGMPIPNQFGPPFGMQGRGSPGGPGPAGQRVPPPGHPQHYSGQYPTYPGPQRGVGPPHSGNLSADHMSPSPQVSGHGAQQRVAEDGPLAPGPEMVKNIEILAGFVVKNGQQFEDMARLKQADDPGFGFLFGGELGSEAAIGKAYYEWKKGTLMAAKDNSPSPVTEAPPSPDGSDMDMEDDFEEPPQIVGKRGEQAKELGSSQPARNEAALPSRMETNSRPQGAQNPRVPTPLTVSNQGNSATASQNPSQLPSHVAVSSRPHSDTAYDELPKRKDTRRRTGFDRPTMEDVTPVPSPRQGAPSASQEKEASAAAGQGQRSRGSSRVSRWGPQDQSHQQDMSRRVSSPVDMPSAPKKISEQDSERPHKKEAERPELEDRLEAVTPERDDDSEHGREGAKDSLSKDIRSEERKSTRSDRDQCKDSPLRPESRKAKDSDNRRSRDSPSRLEDSRTSPRASKQQKGVSEADPGNRPPTVDEFGRFVRPGGSESDADDSQYDRRRRSGSASRSRSRSPASRRRRRSRSRSPRRHGRWSRSRSRSPRRRRSWSKSPPRDSRRGGDGGRGWDRGHQDRSDRGGRRGGRGGGRDPPACLDFARGRCKRGNSCRFLHADTTNGSTAEGRHERGGGRGGRGSRQDDRQDSHDGGRSLGGGSSRSSWGEETPRTRRGWEPSDEKEKDYNKELPKSFEQLAREQPETSPVSDYGDDFGAKPSDKEVNDKFHQESKVTSSLEAVHVAGATASLPSTQAPYSGDPGGLPPPPLSQLPPPPPPLAHSQGFPPSSLPQQQPSFNMSYLPSQSGFSHLPPPPPPPPMNQTHHIQIIHQPAYASSGIPQPGLPQPGLSHQPVGGQSVAPISRSGYTWQSTPTAAPASIAYSVQPVQVSGAPSYSFPPPPSTTYTSTLPQYQLPQQSQVGQSGGQFNMMAGRPEPGPPGAGDAGLKAGENNASRHSVDHWKGSGGNGSSMHMDDVILESVSPGLPGHHHMENVSPGPGSRLVMESVSPALVAHASNPSMLPQQVNEAPQQDNPSGVGLENVSPAPERPQSWSPGGGGETNKSEKRTEKRSKRDKDYKSDKEDHKVRGLTLLRTAVAEHVKETLKPTWREGQMSKEAFKTIAKKAVDKVLSAIKPHQVPNTEEKVATYMVNARPKIAKLVQGYVDKYVKA